MVCLTDADLKAIREMVEADTPGELVFEANICIYFIASSRTDVVRLLDEVERLRSENVALQERVRGAELYMGWEMRDVEDAESVREEKPGD